MTREEWQPDLFDLIGWAIEYQPELYAAVRFLHAPELYNVLLLIWEKTK